jgi:hypothetical protein
MTGTNQGIVVAPQSTTILGLSDISNDGEQNNGERAADTGHFL